MPSEIEQAFTSVYKIRQKRREDRQDYLDRLVEAVNKTSDDDWEMLTEEAQQWFNQAVKAWDVKKSIPDFPDFRQDDESSKRRVVKKTAPPKKRRVNGVRKGPLAVSGSSIIKRALLRNLRATDKELEEILKKKDVTLSPVRVSIVKNEFRHSMRLLQEDGKLKDKYVF